MKSQWSPVGLMGLWLMEGSPTSPTTLEGGTSGTTQAETPLPREFAHVLYSLGYVEDLASEADIAAAVEVARQDWPQWRAA